MDLFNSPVVGDRRILTRLLDGDQEVLSQDTSYFREGSCSAVNKNSPIFILAGNQLVMKYWSHNVAITEQGAFMGRDDPGACSLICWCEDDTLRYFGAPTANRGILPVFTLSFTQNVNTGAMTINQTAGIVGTTAVNNANAGAIGEYLTATIATPGTTLTTATSVNVITAGLSLTAGDWDVWANISYLPAATTSITLLNFGLSSTTGTLGTAGTLGQVVEPATVPGSASPISFPVPMIRVNQASTAAVFLVCNATFTVSTLSAFGTIFARRVR
jgi:hypothetical protein